MVSPPFVRFSDSVKFCEITHKGLEVFKFLDQKRDRIRDKVQCWKLEAEN